MNEPDRRDRLAELAAKLSISTTSLTLFGIGPGASDAAISRTSTDINVRHA